MHKYVVSAKKCFPVQTVRLTLRGDEERIDGDALEGELLVAADTGDAVRE
jgi:hypothetical protein